VSKEIRPRSGFVERIDGTREEVRFVPMDDPDMFLAVTLDGQRVWLGTHDTITADILGKGQSIAVMLKLR